MEPILGDHVQVCPSPVAPEIGNTPPRGSNNTAVKYSKSNFYSHWLFLTFWSIIFVPPSESSYKTRIPGLCSLWYFMKTIFFLVILGGEKNEKILWQG